MDPTPKKRIFPTLSGNQVPNAMSTVDIGFTKKISYINSKQNKNNHLISKL